MSQLDKKKNEVLIKIDQDINKHRSILKYILIFVALGYLAIGTNQISLSDSLETWGTFGDFFGGILNPIFALFAFYWLTYSVRLQIEELKETREELSKAAKAQEESAKHQEEIARLESKNVNTQIEILELNKDTLKSQKNAAIAQQQQVAIQNFENLFFQLLKTKTDVTNDILVGAEGTLKRFSKFNVIKANDKIGEMVGNSISIGKESIKDHLILFKSHVLDPWENFYTDAFLDYAGSYFRVCYQILKLIDQNEILKKIDREDGKSYSKKQKEYFDIFRATFTQYELEALFFNCLCKYGDRKFKKILEKYGMFKPLLIDNDRSNERLHALTRYAYRYDKEVFEKNNSWEDYFDGIFKLRNNNMENIVSYIIILFDLEMLGFSSKIRKEINELSFNISDFEKVGLILRYIDNLKISDLKERYLNRLNYLDRYLSKCYGSAENSVDMEFWLGEIDKTKKERNILQEIKNIDDIIFILNSRILPSEFLTHYGNKRI